MLARIAAIPGKLEGETVYEVGPGPGGLTRALLDAGAKVVAVERDRRCIAALAELEASFGARLTVVEADALRVDERALAGDGAHVVANLPYNIGTALLLKWLGGDWPPWWRSLTLMFQKEVAERIVASPGQRRVRTAVGRGAMALDPADCDERQPLGLRPAAEGDLRRGAYRAQAGAGRSRCGGDGAAYQAAFGQRRKMLRSSLKPVAGALQALETLGIDPRRRAETLTVDDFVALARALS